MIQRRKPRPRFTPTRVGDSVTLRICPNVLEVRGSPPPAWGQPLCIMHARDGGDVGFTPTRVGTAFRNNADRRSAMVFAGSPPPAWGQRQRSNADQTTALRGSPPPAWGQRVSGVPVASEVPGAVHPHPRGDSRVAVLAVHFEKGSPPPAWGQRQAWTGPRPPREVHPHPRGDSPNCTNTDY